MSDNYNTSFFFLTRSLTPDRKERVLSSRHLITDESIFTCVTHASLIKATHSFEVITNGRHVGSSSRYMNEREWILPAC